MIVKVLGIGGGGAGVIRAMHADMPAGVERIVVDSARLAPHPRGEWACLRTIDLGPTGGDPAMGRQAAFRECDRIGEALRGGEVAILVAALGRGLGTGATPVVGEIARAMGLLTVSLVTLPFAWEGDERMRVARATLPVLRDAVDACIVAPSEKLLADVLPDLPSDWTFDSADRAIADRVSGMVDLIARGDSMFPDVRAVLTDGRQCAFGVGIGTGDRRVAVALDHAFDDPLLKGAPLDAATRIRVIVVHGDRGTTDERTLVSVRDALKRRVAVRGRVSFALAFDERLGAQARISVLASGFEVATAARDDSLPIGVPALNPLSARQPTPAAERDVAGGARTRLEAPGSPVRLGASAPTRVGPRQEFTARFVAYHPDLAYRADVALKQPGAKVKSRPFLAEANWKRGARVVVSLTGDHLQVTPAFQGFSWDGAFHALDFDVVAVPDASPDETRLKFDVAIDGCVVARLRLGLHIGKRRSLLQWLTGFAGRHSVSQPAARTAFASYAARDRPRVLDRVASLQITAGLDVWLDCLSLRPNESWKPRLEREIRSRDLFMLFWSEAAARSEWVEWEWRTAVARGGTADVQVHPLEPWPAVPLPPELADRHVGDPLMAVRAAAVAEQQRSP